MNRRKIQAGREEVEREVRKRRYGDSKDNSSEEECIGEQQKQMHAPTGRARVCGEDEDLSSDVVPELDRCLLSVHGLEHMHRCQAGNLKAMIEALCSSDEVVRIAPDLPGGD